MSEEQTPVAELFERDPLSLSQQDLMSVISHLRESRKKFVAGSMTAGKPAAKKTAAEKKAEAIAKVTGDVDLGDLGL